MDPVMFMGALVSFGTAHGATLDVGPNSTYATLQEALGQSSPGDRIVIEAGRYTEDINITNVVGVTIVGAGRDPDPALGTVFDEGVGQNLAWIIDSDIVLQDMVLDGVQRRRVIRADGSTVLLDNVLVRNGVEQGGAGLLAASNSEVTVTNARFEDHSTTANFGGGAIRAEYDAMVIVEDSEIEGSTSGVHGGGIGAWFGASLTLRRSIVADNVASWSGGGVYCQDALLCQLEDVVLQGNTASTSDGGGMFATNTVDVSLLRVQACGNQADIGGGLHTQSVTRLVVQNSTFWANQASSAGGAYVVLGDVLFRNNTFVGNTATGQGGGLTLNFTDPTRIENNLWSGGIAQGGATGTLHLQLSTMMDGGYDLYYDNVPSDVYPGPPLTPVVLSDPLLPDQLGCATPLPALTSPAIDGGDPLILDPDGSRSDIGASGGPWALRDRDQDDFFDGEDCDDDDPAVSPAGNEVCGGGDEDCDGLVDLVDPSVDPETLVDTWVDDDGDGFGAGQPERVCTPAPDAAMIGGDCDDGDAKAFPDAPEECNGRDDDCDLAIDEGCDSFGAGPRIATEAPVGTGCTCASTGAAGMSWIGVALLPLVWLRRRIGTR